VVKHAKGRYAAECLPTKITQRLIQSAAAQAVGRLAQGKAPAPFILDEPVSLAVEFTNSAMADHAMRMPGAGRDGTRVSLSLPDMVTAYNAFRGIVALASLG
jgi:D-aminopeptidase